ncbi:unnamed protein product, partial [Darwinula stevensoni]
MDLTKSFQLFGVKFAPLVVPFERRRQTFAAAFWMMTFLFLGPLTISTCFLFFFYSPLSYLVLIYPIWFLYDWRVCERGGRRVQWIREWRLWRDFANYFPIKMVKTAELNPDKNYILCYHPHGILCAGAFCCFSSEGTDFSKTFPGITSYLLTIKENYYVPGFREFFMCSGAVAATKASMNYLLTKQGTGNAVCLVVGGAAEALKSTPRAEELQVILKERKGFIKMALRTGASLVPVFAFGENEIYDQVDNPEGSWLRKFQETCRSWIGMAPALFQGRGFFQYSFGIIPYRKPINVVRGLRKSFQLFGVKFAPLVVPFERRRQTFAAAFWMMTFLFLGPFTIFTCFLFFFYSPLSYLVFIYPIWFLYDWRVCERGGRRVQWIREWRLWRDFANYFPIKMVKTAELNPDKNYILCCHPHGILCAGAFCCFSTEGTDFSKTFPGITSYLLTIKENYYVPGFREFFMCSGAVAATKASMNYLLTKQGTGNAVCLVVGGAAEALKSTPRAEELQVILKERKGFIKMALRTGASLVPVFAFGENEIYDQVDNPEGSWLRKFQETCRSWIGMAPALFQGRGFFQYSFGIIPYRKPINVVIGSPLDVEKKENPS